MVLGVLFAVIVPPMEKLDEFIHWDYIRYLRQEGHLPDQRDSYIQEFPGEFHQPPLYYVPGALLTSLIPLSDPPMRWEPVNHFGFAFVLTAIPDNPNGVLHDPANLAFPWRGDWLSLHILRFYSLVLGALALIPTFWLAWIIFEDEALALGVVGWIAFRPSVLSLNSTVSNDPLLLLMGTTVLALCALIIACGPTWRRAVWLGIFLGLTALTKFTWPATAVVVPLVFLLAPGFRKEWKKYLAQLALASGIASLMISWWFIRNFILYGDPTGISLGPGADRPDRPAFLPIRSSPPTWEEAGRTAWTSFRRYWAHYGVVGMPDWVNVAFVALTVLLIGGLLYLLLSRRFRLLIAQPRAAFLVLLVTALYVAQSVALFMVNEHGGQVRYVYAGFAAMAAVSQMGLLGLFDLGARLMKRQSQPSRYWLAVIPAALLIPASVYGLFGVLRPAYDLPRRVTDPALLADQYDHPADVHFGETITLIGFQIEPRLVRPGETLFVTLCWESGGPLDEALPYAVHVVDEADNKIGERNTHPGLGMYATLYWEPGVAFCDRVRVPLRADAAPLQTYRVTLNYFHEDTLEPVPATLDNGAVQNLVILGMIGMLPERWPEADPPRYRVGDGLLLADPNLTHEGPNVSVRLQWQALSDIPRDYTTFVHVIDSEGQLATQADVQPRGGQFPTSFWPEGAVVEDAITVPVAGLAPGLYHIRLGMYDSQTVERLPIQTMDGEPLPDSVIDLGTIRVE